MLICLDAGHGGHDPGAVSPEILLPPVGGEGPPSTRRLLEKDVALDVVLRLERHLLAAGVNTVLTRDGDAFVELGERARIANQAGADLFVSVHTNAHYSRRPSGIEAWHFGSSEGRVLARSCYEAMMRVGVGHRGRGLKVGNFQVLRQTIMPATLLELEFISNPKNARWLATEAIRERLAFELARALVRHAEERVSGITANQGAA